MADQGDKPDEEMLSLESIVNAGSDKQRGQEPGLAAASAPSVADRARATGDREAAGKTGAEFVSDFKSGASPASPIVEDEHIETLFKTMDPDFEASLADLKTPILSEEGTSGVVSLADGEGIHAPISEEVSEAPESATFSWRQRLRALPRRWRESFQNLVFFIRSWLVAQVRMLPQRFKSIAVGGWTQYKRFRKWFRRLGGWQVFWLAALIALAVVLVWVVRLIFGHGFIHAPADYLMRDFRQVADQVYAYDREVAFEEYYSALRLPEYIVLMDKLVVNLQPSATSTSNPMGTFQFYLEGTKRESAIEFKNREREFLDVIQRLMEEMTYDDLRTVRGKQKLKVKIRDDLNNLMNHGRVRRVYIKHFITKP